MTPGQRQAILGATRLPSGLFNFNRSSLIRWKSGWQNVAHRNANTRIACIGDSTTVGLDSQGGLSLVGIKSGSYPAQLAQYLKNAGVYSESQNCFCDFGYGTNAPVNDPRLSMGSWSLNSGVQAMAGQTYQASGSGAGTLSFTPSIPTDTCDIYYVTNTSTGSFNANVNGGTNTLQSTQTTAGYGKLTISGSLGSNVYNVLWASGGSVFIVGFNAYNSAFKQVSVLNLGQGGATAGAILNNVWVSATALLTVLAPSLTIIQIGINDWIGATAAGTFTTNLSSIIAAGAAVGDILLMSPMQSASSVVAFASQQPYLDNFQTLALANRCCLIDVNKRWNYFPAANAKGFYAPDGIHGEYTAYSDEALAAGQLLLAA